MDNASKAIIMAGAVLIAIGLVGLGVYLYRSGSGVAISTGDELSMREIQQMNAKFTQYDGVCLGVEVKSLIKNVRSHNATYSDYQVTLKNNGTIITNYDNAIRDVVNNRNYTVDLTYDNDFGNVTIVNYY